jgi:hypothetical protein
MSEASVPSSRAAPANAAGTVPARKSNWGCSIGAAFAVLATMFLCSGATYVVSTINHAGEEFSPQIWERRSYSFGELHPFHYQLWGITRTPIGRSSFENYLVGQKLVPLKAKAERWDVLWSMEYAPLSYKDAAILTRAFDEIGPTGGFVWHRWSLDHPEMAKVLWPCVAALAEDYLYVYVPEILDLARDAEDPAEFEKKLLEKMQAIYSDLAEDERSSGRTAAADRLGERAALFAKPDWREVLFADAVEPPASIVKESEKEPEIVVPPVVEEEEDEEKPEDDKKSDGDKPEDDKSETDEESDDDAKEDASEPNAKSETSP